MAVQAKAITMNQVAAKAHTPWWQKGIIYQIYVRSFYDANGDGVGDIPGITSSLDYLKELGVDGLWLTPITVSANDDWGYDVVDYYSVDPHLGTMADFENLLAEAKKRDIRIILDFVPNHTSVHHPWFQSALTGRDAKYRDYYIWAEPKPGNKPPSNWKSAFGGSAWSYHAPTRQYYLHNFLSTQAELNWRNPKVREEFDKIMRFWLDKGVGGFRVDVFNMLIKDIQYRDNPTSYEGDGLELRLLGQRPLYNTSRPETHKILKRWRKVINSYPGDRLLLGESTLLYNVHQLAEFYGNHDELELAFNLAFIHEPFRADTLRRIVEETEDAIITPDWPVWANSNHDQSRFATRWAHGDERKIRCGLMMLFALKGTPVVYYGDEIGMGDTFVPPWRLKDPIGKKYWPVYGGRDRARTPMQWKNQEGAGFTAEQIRPWLPYGDLGRNVNDQSKDSASTLKFSQDLIALRRRLKDLHLGTYKTLPSTPQVWAWQRGKGIAVIINLSNRVEYMVGLSGEVLIGTDRKRDGKKLQDEFQLAPWEGIILKLK